MSLPEKEMLNRVDLSSRRNDINDGMVLTDDGRAFQARVAVRLHWKPKREETTLKRQQHILWFYLVFPIIGPYPVSSSHFGQVALLTFRVRLLQSLRLVHQLHFGTLMIGSVFSTLGIIRSELRYIYCTLVHLTFGTPVGTLSVFCWYTK